MSATFTPTGMIPIRKRGGVPNNAAQGRYRINPAGVALTIVRGDPVALNAGYVVRVTAATDWALGVFWGCSYNDIVTKRPTYSPIYLANTSVGTDPKGIQCFVIDDPDTIFAIQADASVSVGDVGVLNFEVTISAGNVVTGQSAYGLDAGTRTAASALLRIVDIYDAPLGGSNAFSDPFPWVEVEWVQHRDFRVSAQ